MEDKKSLRLADPKQEPHIVIHPDRSVTVPEELKNLAVQYDHNIETVIFDCPRYWDGNDMSTMGIRINYEREDGYGDCYVCTDVTADEEDSKLMHFSWTISRNVSDMPGILRFAVCAIRNDSSAVGNEAQHWSSRICEDARVLPGLDYTEHALETQPDVILAAWTATKEAQAAAEKTTRQYEEMKKQAALIGDGNVGTVTGPRVDSESLDSAAVVKEIPGKTVQDRSTGAQLFDASKLPTKTQGGATVTNNGDGSFTVSGSGNLTSEFNNSAYYGFAPLLKVGKLKLNNADVRPLIQVIGLAKKGTDNGTANDRTFLIDSTNKEISITQEIIDRTVDFKVVFYGTTSTVIKPGTIKPMLYQDGDGTWEPYTGGKPTPRPDYPVMVQGVGDTGYFDGALLQGYYSIVDGTLVGASDYICNENKIPCNSGDEISITVKKDGIEDFQFLFYKKNGTYIGNVPNWTAKAPEGTAFVCFRMKKTGLTTRNAGHISLAINGKYSAMIRAKTVNLFDYRRLPSKTQGGATVTNNGDGSFTISGSGNINGDYPNNYKISHDEIIKRFKAGKLFAKSEKVTAPYFFVNLNKDKTYVKTLVELSNKNYYTADILQEYLDDSSYSFVIGINGNKNQLIKPGTIKPMLYQDGDGTYQPYKESSSMIPITQPLYAGDKVYQKDGELWLHRENAEVTFDGSEDENWVLYNGQFYTTKDDMKKSNSYVDNLFCDRFQTDTNNSAKNDNTITGHWDSTLYPDKNWIYITKTDIESVSALKTWLQSNPVTVVYKLAVPVEERITAEEAYNLRTYAPYCTIWTPDDLDPEFLVDTAKNLAGAYALEGYARVMKDRARIEGNQEQLRSRILALEVAMVKGGE